MSGYPACCQCIINTYRCSNLSHFGVHEVLRTQLATNTKCVLRVFPDMSLRPLCRARAGTLRPRPRLRRRTRKRARKTKAAHGRRALVVDSAFRFFQAQRRRRWRREMLNSTGDLLRTTCDRRGSGWIGSVWSFERAGFGMEKNRTPFPSAPRGSTTSWKMCGCHAFP